MLKLRKITIDDRERILEISAKIWEGDDYLAYVLDPWLDDLNGFFLAVLDGNELIAFQKISYFTKTDVWLMGLRKDPDSQVKGVGLFINREVLKRLAENRELTSIRFATYIENYQSISLFKKLGFKLALKRSHKFISVENTATLSLADTAVIKNINDLEKIKVYLYNSDFFNSLHNLINIGWEVYPFSEKLILEKFIETQNCHALLENGEIKALALISYLDCGYLTFFDAENQDYAQTLIEYLKLEVQKRGLSELSIFLTENRSVKSLVENCGFESWEWEDDFLMYELPLKKLYSDYSQIEERIDKR